MDGFWGEFCSTPVKRCPPAKPSYFGSGTYSVLFFSGFFHVSENTGKCLENWAEAPAPHINLTPHSEIILDWWQKGRIALSSLTFPKRLASFSAAVTSVNFISKWDLEGLDLKSAPPFWFPPNIMIFSRVQDPNAGEIMSTSHYCKLYPPLVPITQPVMNLNTSNQCIR